MLARCSSAGAALAVALTLALLPAETASAGFAGTDVVIPASARAPGAGQAQFYSTLWVTNLAAAPALVQLRFLERDVSNLAPQSVSFTLPAGETRKYENVIATLFGRTNASGALWVEANQDVLVSSRTYNLPTGSSLRDANGSYFAGIPRSLAIATGDVALLQGVSQGGSEDFRYNFGLVEVGGSAATVRITVREANGAVLGQKDYVLQAFEPKQWNVSDLLPSPSTSNAVLEARGIAGAGRVLVYGTGIANGSQDSIGFEMSFRGGLAAGVASLNGLTGAVTLAAGANVTLTPAGNTLTIAAAGGTGGLSLPYVGSASTGGGNAAFAVSNSGAGAGILAAAQDKAIVGTAVGTGANVVAIQGTLSAANPPTYAAAVRGQSLGTGDGGIGVWGSNSGGGPGVYGSSVSGPAIFAASETSAGVIGISQTSNGILGMSAHGIAIRGATGEGSGYNPVNPAEKASAVWGDATTSSGVLATSRAAYTGALQALSLIANGRGVEAYAQGAGSSAVYAVATSGATQAGYFQGTVNVTGTLSKAGGSFRIDHPLDPANRYLLHSFVESPDMLNVYSGIAVLDARGEAEVVLPDWMEPLNRDFRYQLTCIGAFAPVYVSRKVTGNRFRIAGGKPGLEVSWQLTGVRQDRWAEAHRIPVEEDKPEAERGFYLHPKENGQPEEKGLDWARDPARMEELVRLRALLTPQ